MSTGITQKQLKDLQRMTDAEFANVLLIIASVGLGGTSAASGFWARFSTLNVGGLVKSQATKQFIVRLVADLFAAAIAGGVAGALNSDIIKEAVINEIFKATGLELETLDAESAKKAVGKLMAEKLNEQYGTQFTTFYPPAEAVNQIKLQIQNEVIEALA